MAAETPTIVLVHGAWADATGFDAEIRALQAAAIRAIGFGDPLHDIADDASYLAESLWTLTGPVVLVGSSYGDNVISMAATGNDQVQALDYFNCDVRRGRDPGAAPWAVRKQPRRPPIRPVPFTGPDGSEGTDLCLAPEAFAKPSPPIRS